MNLKKPEKNMVNGLAARSFPVLADSKNEEKATSLLLSLFFIVVTGYATAVLDDAGASGGGA